MKNVIVLAVLGLLLTVGNAQANCGKCGMGDGPKDGDKQAMAAERLEMMTKELALTPEQKGQMQALMKEKMEKKQAIMEKTKSEMDAIHEEFKTKIKSILNEEQMKKWEAKEAAKGDMKGKKKHEKEHSHGDEE